MDIEIRPPRADEYEAVLLNDGRAFGVTYLPIDADDIRPWMELDRYFVALDDGEVVGTAGTWTFELTMPGLTTVPCGGLTWVAVAATHRRRGILRRLMATHLDHVAERGEPIATLTASESGIYERFGYGMATARTKLVADRRFVTFRPDVEIDPVRFVDAATARKLLPDIYDRFRRAQPGAVGRNEKWWDFILRDREHLRGGGTALHHVVHPDGFVSYRINDDHQNGFAANRVNVRDFAALTPRAYAALWHFLLNIDLSREVEWNRAAVDEPLRWLVTEPRQIRTEFVDDDVWARPVDVATLLAGRRYAVEDRLVLEVVDDFRPATGGRFEVEGSPDGATCRRTTATADFTLGVADLGTIALGAFSASLLAQGQRIGEATPGAIRRADAFFVSEPKAHNTTGF